MKNSLTRKLLLAVITLGIAVIATVGSTYAWFSMNTTVEATGMQITAVTPVNVVISKSENDGFGPSVEFSSTLNKLFPASTTVEQLTSSSVAFWAVQEGQVIGDNGKGGLSSSATKFQTSVISSATPDGEGRSYFIKETLWLKTTAGKISLVLEEINLNTLFTTPGSSATEVPSSAVVESDGNSPYEIKEALYVALITDDQTLIYAVDGTGTYTGVASVDSTGTRTLKGSAETPATVGSAGTLVFDSAESATIALDTTAKRVQVVVWLEGEDPDCVNAIGGQGLTLDLKFGYKEGSYKD